MSIRSAWRWRRRSWTAEVCFESQRLCADSKSFTRRSQMAGREEFGVNLLLHDHHKVTSKAQTRSPGSLQCR